MLDVLDSALAWGGREQADRLAGQGSIFDLGDDRRRRGSAPPPTDPRDEFDKSELLGLEKETLGLYVSEHPLSAISRAAAAQGGLHAARAGAAS